MFVIIWSSFEMQFVIEISYVILVSLEINQFILLTEMGRRPKRSRWFTWKKLLRSVKSWIWDTLDSIWPILIPLAQKYTPVDLWELIAWFVYTADRANLKSNITNTAEHYWRVELWTRTAFNYYKWDRRTWWSPFRRTWQRKWLSWARMTQQAVDELVSKRIITRQLTINVRNRLSW